MINLIRGHVYQNRLGTHQFNNLINRLDTVIRIIKSITNTGPLPVFYGQIAKTSTKKI